MGFGKVGTGNEIKSRIQRTRRLVRCYDKSLEACGEMGSNHCHEEAVEIRLKEDFNHYNITGAISLLCF